MIRVFCKTFGCKVNQADVLDILAELEKSGRFTVSDSITQCDIVLIAGCIVTGRSVQKINQFARKSRSLNKYARLAVYGCYPEVYRDRLEKENLFDIAIPLSRKAEVTDILIDSVQRLQYKDKPTGSEEIREPVFRFKSRPGIQSRGLLKIQDGCNSRCSYCIVRVARGRSRSLAVPEVIKRLQYLLDRGFEEIILAGINLGSYGLDLPEKSSLLKLLEKIESLPGKFLIRLSSLEPNTISDELIDFISQSKHVCPHLHIPLQSASDRILKAMNRPYSSSQYSDIIRTARKRIKNLTAGADVMVGFPGETQEDFQTTVAFLEKNEIDYFHVFRYSPRPLTAAYSFIPTVDDLTKKKRSRFLTELSRTKIGIRMKHNLGKILRCLVIGTESPVTGYKPAVSENYLKVLIPEDKALPGKIVTVRTENIIKGYLIGLPL